MSKIKTTFIIFITSCALLNELTRTSCYTQAATHGDHETDLAVASTVQIQEVGVFSAEFFLPNFILWVEATPLTHGGVRCDCGTVSGENTAAAFACCKPPNPQKIQDWSDFLQPLHFLLTPLNLVQNVAMYVRDDRCPGVACLLH